MEWRRKLRWNIWTLGRRACKDKLVKDAHNVDNPVHEGEDGVYAVFRTKYDGKELSSYEAKSGFYVNTIKTISSKLFLSRALLSVLRRRTDTQQLRGRVLSTQQSQVSPRIHSRLFPGGCPPPVRTYKLFLFFVVVAECHPAYFERASRATPIAAEVCGSAC